MFSRGYFKAEAAQPFTPERLQEGFPHHIQSTQDDVAAAEAENRLREWLFTSQMGPGKASHLFPTLPQPNRDILRDKQLLGSSK